MKAWKLARSSILAFFLTSASLHSVPLVTDTQRALLCAQKIIFAKLVSDRNEDPNYRGRQIDVTTFIEDNCTCLYTYYTPASILTTSTQLAKADAICGGVPT